MQRDDGGDARGAHVARSDPTQLANLRQTRGRQTRGPGDNSHGQCATNDSGASGELVTTSEAPSWRCGSRARGAVGAASGEPRAAVLVLPVAIAGLWIFIFIDLLKAAVPEDDFDF